MDSTRREVSTESSSDEDSIIDSTKVRDLVLPMQLALVEGPDRLPADEGRQEELSRKLCVLEADLSGVTTLLSELAAQLVSINSVERTIHITFKSFEEVWKFSTYHRMGFLGQCMENLLVDQEFWLISLDLDLGIEISINEETLYLMYSGFLMQEGSFFGYCTANQMFDSSTSGSDIYLEKGDIALFEPPFLDSGWTVLSLPDGAKGTKPKPAVEPVIPFHEWFLKSCQECVLVGGTKSSNDLTFQIAVGVCETTEEYAADGTDELSFQSGERINVLGLLVSCFEWFLGRSERTGEIGLVRTRMVKETGSICESSSIFLKGEDRQIVSLDEEKTKTNTIAILKSNCQSDFGTNYKLGNNQQFTNQLTV